MIAQAYPSGGSNAEGFGGFVVAGSQRLLQYRDTRDGLRQHEHIWPTPLRRKLLDGIQEWAEVGAEVRLPGPPLLYDDLHQVCGLLSRQWLNLGDRAGDPSASHLKADHVADRRWTPIFDGLTQLGAVLSHDNASVHARGLSHGDLDTFSANEHHHGSPSKG